MAVVVVPESVAIPVEDFACSLVGRVLSFVPLDGGRVARLFRTIWKGDKHWFALEHADPACTIHDYAFRYMCIWVRIHNIPLSLMTEALARTLGACIGKVVMTDTRLEDGNMGEFLRVRVSLDTTKPLRRCVTLSRSNAKAILCPLQYEHISIFCHGCGLIGHTVLQCPTTPQREDQKLQYGAWLRAPFLNECLLLAPMAGKVNFSKSTAYFSPRTPPAHRTAVHYALGVQEVDDPGIYLGVPLLIGKNNGREVLIKSVAQALPQYVMSYYLLPSSLVEEMSHSIRRFWWSGKGSARGWPLVAWDDICLPKAAGGIGFKDLHLFNIALLGKQLWRLLSTPDSLLCRTLRAKYFPNGDLFSASAPTRSSFAWKGLHRAMLRLRDGFFWTLGIDSQVRLFRDRWGGFSPITLDGDAIDREEIPLRCRVPISSNRADTLVWGDHDSGLYTVRSGYLFLRRPPFPLGSPPHLWKILAKLPTIPKVRSFGWRCCRDALPVGSRLRDAGLSDGACPLCGVGFEDVLHVLRDCPDSSAALRQDGFNGSLLFADQVMVVGWLGLAASSLSLSSFALLLSVLWGLWRRRNTWVHERSLYPLHLVVEDAVLLCLDYTSASTSTRISPPAAAAPPRWRPPPVGSVKVNVDGAFLPSARLGAIGVIARDSSGAVLGSFAKPIPIQGPASTAEVTALFAGLEFSVANAWPSALIESDAAVLVNKLHQPTADLSLLGDMLAPSRALLAANAALFRNCANSGTLNRFIADNDWFLNFPTLRSWSEYSPNSDHHFILLDTVAPFPAPRARGKDSVFRFDDCWAREPECISMVQSLWAHSAGSFADRLATICDGLRHWQCAKRATDWERIPRLRSEINRLSSHRLSPEDLEVLLPAKGELCHLLKVQEAYWAQRSRVLWLSAGDQNTSFFHAKASARKKKNALMGLYDDNGYWQTSTNEVLRIASDYFVSLFSANPLVVDPAFLEHIAPSVTEDMNSGLLATFTAEEVITAFRDINPRKSPGIDGLLSGFFRQHWDILGEDFVSLCLDLLRGHADMASVNETVIVLIPKVDKPTSMRQLRPISLCTVIYKTISKISTKSTRIIKRAKFGNSLPEASKNRTTQFSGQEGIGAKSKEGMRLGFLTLMLC
ncbi:hypothetical protein GQ457_03G016830 [Hibiscus cannabinus]